MKNKKNTSLKSAALIVMSSIIISRLTGFAREMLVPNMLGVNEVGDAYNLAFRITGLMYDLLVGGAIAAALIPILSGYIARDEEEEGWKAVSTFINVIFIAMICFCILGMIFAPQIISMIALGFESEYQKTLTIKLTRILFPSVAFLMLAGLSNGVLNSYNRFAAASYGPSIYNIGCALSIYFLSGSKMGVQTVAYGVMISAAIYFLFQLSFVVKNMKFYRFKLFWNHDGFRKLFKLAIPSMISSSIVQINVIISGAFSTLFVAGSVTAFNMADRTWQMPYGVFAQGIGIALLPTLSAKVAMGKMEEFKTTLMKGLRTVLILTIPSGIGFIVLKEDIIRTIFKFTSRFDEKFVPVAGNILMFFSIALLTQSIVAIMTRGFYANNDTKTPLFIGGTTIVLNIALSYLFYKFTYLGVAGMALAYSLASTVNAFGLFIVLNKKVKGLYYKQFANFLVKVIASAIIMGSLLYFIKLIFPTGEQIKLMQILLLIGEIGIGAIVYFLAILIMKVDEGKEFVNMILLKLGLKKEMVA